MRERWESSHMERWVGVKLLKALDIGIRLDFMLGEQVKFLTRV